MPSIFAIAVIGQRGQLLAPADTPWFREMTWGKELAGGADTLRQLPPLPGRVTIEAESFRDAEQLRSFVHGAGGHIFLIGGAKTFAKFAGVVDRWYIDKTSYDGPSDEWFNPMWLVAES